jgi:hypothetical protein
MYAFANEHVLIRIYILVFDCELLVHSFFFFFFFFLLPRLTAKPENAIRTVNYFCPYHGKGPCDAFFGLMTRHLNAVVEQKCLTCLADVINTVIDWQCPMQTTGNWTTQYKFIVFDFMRMYFFFVVYG